jgi:isopentenyl-diphosphate delta-isomerase
MVLLVNGKQYNKLDAHKLGLPHYAFSVFIYNSKNKLLMQKRAYHKYHSGGLWTNTCCSHPLTKNVSQINKIAEERLKFEMGICCPLKFAFEFEYTAQCGELVENEHDYVFYGYSDQMPRINPDEVDSYKFADLETVNIRRKEFPQEYSPWFNIVLDGHYSRLSNK